MLETALIGVKSKIRSNQDQLGPAGDLDKCKRQHRLLDKELARVRRHLLTSSKVSQIQSYDIRMMAACFPLHAWESTERISQ